VECVTAVNPHAEPSRHSSDLAHVIELGHLKAALGRGVRLLLETAVVPSMLLYGCTMTVGGLWGLVAVLAWCASTVAVRMVTARRIPGTLLLCVAMLVGRTSLALALSSVYIYLLQPIAGSVLMAVLFIGSAVVGRPITMRLAQDFVHLPAMLLADRRVRRMFVQVSLVWGAFRLLDAGVSIGVLHWGLAAGIFSRGVLSGLLTVIAVLVCAYWGWSQMRRIPGVEFRVAAAPTAA
jgi:hypothetical protein